MRCKAAVFNMVEMRVNSIILLPLSGALPVWPEMWPLGGLGVNGPGVNG